MNTKQTCSCSTCTCTNGSFRYRFNYDDDCLTYALIIIYESSLWCVQIIYDLFFKSFWQILIYVKRELQERKSDNHMSNCYGMKSFNTSRSNNYPLTGEKRVNHTLRIHDSSSLDIYHRSISSLQETNDNRQIVLTPVRSTYCQTEMKLQTVNTTNAMHRPLTQPLIFMNQSSEQRVPQQVLNISKPCAGNQVKLESSSPTSNTIDRSTSTSPRLTIRSHRKPKQRKRFADKHSLPLALATSLHSNVSSYNNKYCYQ
ncbi:unnamed protein product [Adineta ricciae]|uniref:Uncharacterized protein n=1 Tax=Adineta ricciae TaxID=249248 RepID=A0A815LJJ7_ADIRI|nr:unnamed protein product [Adineta ricciae]CAF1410952.1 unnamed protein product [Adineta ricciae]